MRTRTLTFLALGVLGSLGQSGAFAQALVANPNPTSQTTVNVPGGPSVSVTLGVDTDIGLGTHDDTLSATPKVQIDIDGRRDADTPIATERSAPVDQHAVTAPAAPDTPALARDTHSDRGACSPRVEGTTLAQRDIASLPDQVPLQTQALCGARASYSDSGGLLLSQWPTLEAALRAHGISARCRRSDPARPIDRRRVHRKRTTALSAS